MEFNVNYIENGKWLGKLQFDWFIYLFIQFYFYGTKILNECKGYAGMCVCWFFETMQKKQNNKTKPSLRNFLHIFLIWNSSENVRCDKNTPSECFLWWHFWHTESNQFYASCVLHCIYNVSWLSVNYLTRSVSCCCFLVVFVCVCAEVAF